MGDIFPLKCAESLYLLHPRIAPFSFVKVQLGELVWKKAIALEERYLQLNSRDSGYCCMLSHGIKLNELSFDDFEIPFISPIKQLESDEQYHVHGYAKQLRKEYDILYNAFRSQIKRSLKRKGYLNRLGFRRSKARKYVTLLKDKIEWLNENIQDVIKSDDKELLLLGANVFLLEQDVLKRLAEETNFFITSEEWEMLNDTLARIEPKVKFKLESNLGGISGRSTVSIGGHGGFRGRYSGGGASGGW